MTMYKNLTKNEFCGMVDMSTTNWVFNEAGPNPGFWYYDGIFYYDNDKNETRRFKDMPEYKEIWVSVRKYDETGKSESGWSLWSTWKQY